MTKRAETDNASQVEDNNPTPPSTLVDTAPPSKESTPPAKEPASPVSNQVEDFSHMPRAFFVPAHTKACLMMYVRSGQYFAYTQRILLFMMKQHRKLRVDQSY